MPETLLNEQFAARFPRVGLFTKAHYTRNKREKDLPWEKLPAHVRYAMSRTAREYLHTLLDVGVFQGIVDEYVQPSPTEEGWTDPETVVPPAPEPIPTAPGSGVPDQAPTPFKVVEVPPEDETLPAEEEAACCGDEQDPVSENSRPRTDGAH